MKWFKFYGTEYLSDPKMLSLSPCMRSCWITLLSYASINDNENDNGVIHYMTEERLMMQAGLDPMQDEWEETKGVLERFQKLGMILIDNEVITIINWHKRQNKNLTGYERVKKYRQKKRNDNTNDNDRVDKSRVEENRIDNNISKKKTLKSPKGESAKADTMSFKPYEEPTFDYGDNPQEENPKVKKLIPAPKSDNVNTVIGQFKKVNPSYPRLYANKTQRAAIERMLAQHGLEKILWAVQVACAIAGKQYAPTITTPLQLENKLGQLIAFVKKEQVKKSMLTEI